MTYYKKNAKIGRTTNRTLGFLTPTVSDEPCPYFNQRFVRNGIALPENRAICDKQDVGLYCDYYKNVDGIPFCLRYWYGPRYELTDLVRIPFVQKRDEKGNLLFFELDGVTETINYTAHPVTVPVHEAYPLTYNRDDWKEQLVEVLPGGSSPVPVFWDYTNSKEPQKVATDTGYPALKYGNMQFYSSQYEDTHEKRFRASGGRLGWHKDV